MLTKDQRIMTIEEIIDIRRYQLVEVKGFLPDTLVWVGWEPRNMKEPARRKWLNQLLADHYKVTPENVDWRIVTAKKLPFYLYPVPLV